MEELAISMLKKKKKNLQEKVAGYIYNISDECRSLYFKALFPLYFHLENWPKQYNEILINWFLFMNGLMHMKNKTTNEQLQKKIFIVI